MQSSFDPYRELGLSPEAAAEPELVRAAFKALAKKYHPDRHPDVDSKARAEEKMRRLNEAQQLILSGSYSPPSPVSLVATPPAAEPPPPSVASPRRAADPPKSPPRSMSMGPVLVAVAILVASVMAPMMLKRDHLAEALELEKKGQWQQALEKAKQAVADDPRDAQPYLLRARLWLKLGKPDRARRDLANARGSLNPVQYEEARRELFPSPTPAATPPAPKK